MGDLTADPVHTGGGCLCGAVRYEAVGPLRDVVVCHCKMCRRVHGHVGAYTSMSLDALSLVASRGLAWYRSSAAAKRAFCRECGATLFWQMDAGRPSASESSSPPSYWGK